MDLHRVRRLAWVLVASQIRASGRNADPKKWSNQPSVYGWVDVALFAGLFAVVLVALRGAGGPDSPAGRVVGTALPLLPLFGVGAILVGGLMFELTTTAKFASSDAANWLPLPPREYVLASGIALAYSYSIPIAAIVGGFVGAAAAVGLAGAGGLAAVLSAIGLLEGAFLVEMVRAVGQRSGGGSARHNRLGVIARALVFVVLIVVLELAFNPVILFDSLSALHAFGRLTELIPPFWGTYALLVYLAGDPLEAAAFAVGVVAFAGLLLAAANALRQRFWSVSAPESHFGPHRYGDAHPILRRLGLTAAEGAIVAKDLHGFGRRREMMPMLLLPLILLIVIFIDGSVGGGGIGGAGLLIYAGWATAFTALLIASTSLGQERKSIWHLYAAPVVPRSVFRAKLTAAVIPSWAVCVAAAAFVGVVGGAGPLDAVGFGIAAAAASLVLAAWGLGFAARYSDYEERPRPQPMRPMAMLAAVGSGSVLSLAILVPVVLGMGAGGTTGEIGIAVSAGLAAVFGFASWRWARSGFDRMMREIPF
jgi:hypothetical protein